MTKPSATTALSSARSTFAQLAILLGFSIGLVLLAASLVLRSQALAGGTAQLLPIIQTQLALTEKVLAAGMPAAEVQRLLAPLQASLRTDPPPLTATTAYPFPRALHAALLDAGRSSADLRLVDGSPPQLWFLLSAPHTQWLVIPIPNQMRRARDSALLIIAGAALVVFAAAAWLARRQTRTLAALVEHADPLARGQPIAISGLQHASREVQALAHALVDAGTRAREQARAREVMLAGISHDLRSPLARLRFALEMETQGSAQQAMIADVEELDSLLGQFIAYARDGSAEPISQLRVDTLLRTLLQQRAQPALWTLRSAPMLLRIRPLALRRALVNLLDNAERHGQAPFALELSDIPGRPAWLRIVVADHGGGIAADQQQRLLMPFERGDSARGSAGSGLGLAIAQRIVLDAGGELQMHRDAGRARFETHLLLPSATALDAVQSA